MTAGSQQFTNLHRLKQIIHGLPAMRKLPVANTQAPNTQCCPLFGLDNKPSGSEQFDVIIFFLHLNFYSHIKATSY